MGTSTSESARETHARICLLGRGVGHEIEAAEPAQAPVALNYDWKSGTIEEVPLKLQKEVVIESAPLAPVYVHEFAKRVAKIDCVRGVIAETGEDQQSVHVTTFASNLTEGIRNQIYRLEHEMILENPHVAFDFHLRRSEELTGSPAPIAGKYYYAVWGFRDAHAGPASQASDP
jgi:hypothetical protein